MHKGKQGSKNPGDFPLLMTDGKQLWLTFRRIPAGLSAHLFFISSALELTGLVTF